MQSEIITSAAPANGQSQTDRVEHRKGDIARADLQRHDVVDHAGEKRARHEKDHDGAVSAEQLREMIR